MIAAVVLAAGSGARLGGVAKALLRTAAGDTFLGAIARTCEEGLGARRGRMIVVVGPPFGDAVAVEARRLGATVIGNPDPARGMASSIALGFAALVNGELGDSGARGLLWPVDHPHVQPATLAALVAVDAPVVKPTYRGRGGHPPLVARARWPVLARTQNARDDLRDAVAVPVDDPGVVRDIDRPEDLACAR